VIQPFRPPSSVFELKSTSKPVRRALLVGVCWNHESAEEAASLLDELNALVDTMGMTVLERILIKSVQPHARFLLGSGKAAEVIALARARKAEIIVFDHPISPSQQRNWETLSQLAVIDREEVILEIFARRARSREARLQVALARTEYSLPRLQRAWEHLSRQGGTGFGAMGAGETQLETDRRLVRRRISNLKGELAEVHSQRATRRKQRLRRPTAHAAIVGYTNAGKSSLFQCLTETRVLVEDKLFATLDTTTRKIELPDGQSLLLTDTVGFIRKLPHKLIESFKATLEESVLADFLIHVLDVSNPAVIQFHRTTMDVMEELGADITRTITVFNKVDLQSDQVRISSLQRQFPDALFISAHTGQGLPELRNRMVDMLSDWVTCGDYLLPQSRYDLVSSLHRYGRIWAQAYEGDCIRLTASLPPKWTSLFAQYRVNGANSNLLSS